MDKVKATYEGRELDTWIGSYKVRAFPWPASNDIYVNVQYFAPGQSTAKAPAFDKSVFINKSLNGGVPWEMAVRPTTLRRKRA